MKQELTGNMKPEGTDKERASLAEKREKEKEINSRIEYTAEKKARDLEIISQDALKSKIYNYLQTESEIGQTTLIEVLKIYDAVQNTAAINRCVELVSYNISGMDIKCYLAMLEWQFVDVLKLVKVGLTDEQFLSMLDFLQDKRVETVVVSSNKLTEKSCLGVVEKKVAGLKSLYMGKNNIQKTSIKEEIREMEMNYTLYM